MIEENYLSYPAAIKEAMGLKVDFTTSSPEYLIIYTTEDGEPFNVDAMLQALKSEAEQSGTNIEIFDEKEGWKTKSLGNGKFALSFTKPIDTLGVIIISENPPIGQLNPCFAVYDPQTIPDTITSVEIPNTVTTIGTTVFAGCTLIEAITIPENVVEIYPQAFNGCSNLKVITVEATTPPTLSAGAFSDTNLGQIYVPADAVEAYKSADKWSDFEDIIAAIPETSESHVNPHDIGNIDIVGGKDHGLKP